MIQELANRITQLLLAEKAEINASIDAAIAALGGTVAPKRGRGRPRKATTEPVVFNIDTRGSGAASEPASRIREVIIEATRQKNVKRSEASKLAQSKKMKAIWKKRKSAAAKKPRKR